MAAGGAVEMDYCSAATCSNNNIAVEKEKKAVRLDDSSYRDGLLTSIANFRNKEQFTDIVLCIGNHEYHAHRLVLAASSRVFEAMLSADMREKNQGRINLTDSGIKPDILSELLHYICTGTIGISISNVEDLMSAANYFMLTSLGQFCCEFLKENLYPGNCLGIRQIAIKFGYENLLEKAQKIINEDFLVVSLTEEFLSLSPDYLCEILVTDTLEVKSEDNVLEALNHWINFDVTNRRKYFEKLIPSIRIQFVMPQTLEKVENEYKSDFVTALCQKAKQARNARINADELIRVGLHIRPRKCLDKQSVLFICGGYDGMKCMQSSFAYLPDENRCQHLAFMNIARHGHGIAVINDTVFAVGGFNSRGGPLNDVELYHPARNKWIKALPMDIKRKSLGVAVLNGILYAAGGLDGNYVSLKTVECFDPNTERWQFATNMTEPRYNHCLVSDDEYMYSLGGWKTATAEKFDQESKVWSILSPMSCPRAGATSAVLNEKIYMAGGYGENGCLNSMEMYDPNLDLWTSCSDSSVSRWKTSVSTLGDDIFVLGGRDSSWQYLDKIESYNVNFGEWRMDGQLPSKIMGASCSTIDLPSHYLKK